MSKKFSRYCLVVLTNYFEKVSVVDTLFTFNDDK